MRSDVTEAMAEPDTVDEEEVKEAESTEKMEAESAEKMETETEKEDAAKETESKEEAKVCVLFICAKI